MEESKAIIPMREYRELIEFKEGVESGKVLIRKRIFHYGFGSSRECESTETLLSKEETLNSIENEIKELNEKVEEQSEINFEFQAAENISLKEIVRLRGMNIFQIIIWKLFNNKEGDK